MIFSDLFSVIYPHYCLNCGCILGRNESFLCFACRGNLPETTLHLQKENRIIKRFYGQCDLTCATALFYFHKNSAVQHLIHELKYKGKEEIGQWLGKWLGEKIKTVNEFQKTDVVIPVPLHKEKLKKRGYNQVARFAQELARILQATYLDDVLIKIKTNSTQTKKDVWRRFNDSKNIFSIQNQKKIENKNILLVDDIITTGSTIESCYNQLTKAPNTKIGIASMAYSLLNH
ncbi:ComF family protein [Capnocytophaga sp.]|uniref:ComF family protein n=1 Tax=Capnocytophaga sp. TaxID=44737 RepID=UPI0026DCA159|nr:phosphoribosyltransferase family protein [Capnocytophaga sp.]MDO5104398.1 phosphoribosyltransferase family protein [Capnocytophaga sp.]